MSPEKAIDLLIKNPMSVFIILSVGFGYLYYEQNQDLQGLLTEVGGLRADSPPSSIAGANTSQCLRPPVQS